MNDIEIDKCQQRYHHIFISLKQLSCCIILLLNQMVEFKGLMSLVKVDSSTFSKNQEVETIKTTIVGAS
jgi:hypothetical protein